MGWLSLRRRLIRKVPGFSFDADAAISSMENIGVFLFRDLRLCSRHD